MDFSELDGLCVFLLDVCIFHILICCTFTCLFSFVGAVYFKSFQEKENIHFQGKIVAVHLPNTRVVSTREFTFFIIAVGALNNICL